jgi:hypothetical protein
MLDPNSVQGVFTELQRGLGGPFLSNLPHRETRCNRDPPEPDIDTGGVICCLSGSRVSTKMVNSTPL